MEDIINMNIKKINNGFIVSFNNVINGKYETEFFNNKEEIFKHLSRQLDLLRMTGSEV